MSDLDAKAWLAFACLAVVVALLLFVPAGTPRYWQAWAYLAVFFGPSAVGTRYLMKNDPALLRRRLRGGPTAEKETSQKIIMSFIRLAMSRCWSCRRSIIASDGPGHQLF